MKPQLEKVYIPVNGESELIVARDYPDWLDTVEGVKEKKLITFTQEEYNQHIQDVIKDTLQTAADNSDTCEKSVMRGHETVVDKDSITDTFEETFNKFKLC